MGIVGFEPKRDENEAPAGEAPALWPISILFLFDRMIPLYRIRDEHYAIAKVYRRASPEDIEARRGQPGPPYPMYYFGRKYQLSPGGEGDLRRVEKWLVVLRVMGVVFTIFLLAAIGELAR
jgi:hypothetical protein